MRACLALCVVSALVGAALADCAACIGGRCYRKHRLPGARERSVGIDRNTNISYYVDGRGILIKCYLDTAVCNDTYNRWDIGRLTVDQRTGDIYGLINALSSRSLYKMDLVNDTKELLIRGFLFDVVFKDKLYYSTWFGKGIYTFENGESRLLVGTERYRVFNFIVDRDDDVYFFTTSPTLHIVKRLSKGVVDQTEYCDSRFLMSVDADGYAVFIDPHSHTVYRPINGQLVKIGVLNDIIDEIGKPLFNRDNNIIYRNKSKDVFYLKQDRDIQCTVSVFDDVKIVTETVGVTTDK